MRNGIRNIRYSLYICMLLCSFVFAGIDEVKVVDPLTPIYTAEDVKKAPSQDTLILTGPRNGVCSAQAVVLGSGLESVRASISALKKGSSEIPVSAIKVRYAAKEEGFKIGPLDQRKGHTTHNYLDPYYDILLDSPPRDTGVMPVWITVQIPAQTAAGDYTGTLKISSETVPVRLTVTPWICPSPADFTTHVGTNSSTESLALYYGKKVWSEEHWKLIETQMKLLGEIGNDDLWIHALYGLGYRNGKTAMLRFTKQGDKIIPDFTVIDRYFKLYKTYCKNPQFIIVTAWDGSPRGRKGRPGKPEVTVVVDGKGISVPRVYAPGGKEIWGPALNGIKERAEKLGWNTDNILIGLASDNHPSKEEVAGFKEVGFGKWAIWTHGRGAKRPYDVEPGEPYMFEEGMEIGYYVHPYTPTQNAYIPSTRKSVNFQGGIQGGWNINVNIYSSTRNDIHKYHALTQWRAYAAGTTIGGFKSRNEAGGFAFLWFDWFALPGKGMQPFICRVCDVMSRNNSPALVAPGPDGPVATVRYEMLREGIQENEARIFMEKSLVEKKVSGQTGTTAQSVLEEMIKNRFQDGKFHGGHAGGNLGKPDRMWMYPEYPAWQTLVGKLFAQAFSVAKASGAEEYINAAPAAAVSDTGSDHTAAADPDSGSFIETVRARLIADLAKGTKVVVAYRMGTSLKPAQILKALDDGVLVKVNGKEKTIPWPKLTSEMRMSLRKRYKL